MTSKVDSLKLALEDLEAFFDKNKDELPQGNNDQAFYWKKKIGLLQ